MDTKEIIGKISSLVQTDIDAIFAYNEAIQHLEEEEIRTKLSEFQSDHQRHVNILSVVIRRLGGEPPEQSKDFKGYLIEGFTNLRGISGTEGALKAMLTNEKITNKAYESAIQWGLPPDLHETMERCLEDERDHLKYIERALEGMSGNQKVA